MPVVNHVFTCTCTGVKSRLFIPIRMHVGIPFILLKMIFIIYVLPLLESSIHLVSARWRPSFQCYRSMFCHPEPCVLSMEFCSSKKCIPKNNLTNFVMKCYFTPTTLTAPITLTTLTTLATLTALICRTIQFSIHNSKFYSFISVLVYCIFLMVI